MQQILTSREAAKVLGDIDPTTIQRAIGRGELAASRPRDRAPWRITIQDLTLWAASNGYTVQNGNGDKVDPSTGEVLEAPVAEVLETEAPELPAAPSKNGSNDGSKIESNVAAVIMPPATSVAADRLMLLARLVKAGQFDAAQIVVEAWAL
jgi:hypothetical protein